MVSASTKLTLNINSDHNYICVGSNLPNKKKLQFSALKYYFVNYLISIFISEMLQTIFSYLVKCKCYQGSA